MAVPKRKLSKQKVRSRKASAAHKLVLPVSKACPKCGKPHQSHRVCPSCGTYRGRQVLIINADND